MNVLILPFTKVESQIDQLQNDSSGKNNKRTLLLQFAILAEKWSKIAAQKKRGFLGFHDSLLMGLVQDQQQHPAVHTGGVIRGGSVALAFGI